MDKFRHNDTFLQLEVCGWLTYLAWPMYELIRYFLKTIEYFFTNLNQNCCITLKIMVQKIKSVW